MMTAERLEARRTAASNLLAYWEQLITDFIPHISQIYRWLDLYTPEQVEFGIQRVAIKQAKMLTDENEPMSEDHMIRYASGVMSNLKRDENKKKGN
jgi:hypothetical protein